MKRALGIAVMASWLLACGAPSLECEGKSCSVVGRGAVGGLSLFNGTLYWAMDRALWALPEGCDEPKRVADRPAEPRGLVAQDKTLWWLEQGSVWRMTLGEEPSVVRSGGVMQFAVADDGLYLRTERALSVMPVAGGDEVTLYAQATPMDRDANFRLHGDHLFWINTGIYSLWGEGPNIPDRSRIFRVPRKGGAPQAVVVETDERRAIQDFAFEGDRLYWMAYDAHGEQWRGIQSALPDVEGRELVLEWDDGYADSQAFLLAGGRFFWEQGPSGGAYSYSVCGQRSQVEPCEHTVFSARRSETPRELFKTKGMPGLMTVSGDALFYVEGNALVRRPLPD